MVTTIQRATQKQPADTDRSAIVTAARGRREQPLVRRYYVCTHDDGRETTVIDALSGRTTTAYDQSGNVTQVTDALNHST